MKFISHEKMTLLADITNLGGGPAYLSVYSDFDFIEKDVAENIAKEDDYLLWTTNQDSRVLASSIEHNHIEHEFSIPQHLTQLLVQVWFYDGRPAISQAITIDKGSLLIFSTVQVLIVIASIPWDAFLHLTSSCYLMPLLTISSFDLFSEKYHGQPCKKRIHTTSHRRINGVRYP